MAELIAQYWWAPVAVIILIWLTAYLHWMWDRTGGSGSNSNRRGP